MSWAAVGIGLAAGAALAWQIGARRRAERELRRANERAALLLASAAPAPTDRGKAEAALALANRLNEVFHLFPGDEFYGEMLDVVLEVMRSRYGVFAYLAEDGSVVAPSMTRVVWEKCQVPDKRIVFPRGTWGSSLWGRAIAERRSLYSNGTLSVPQGHIRLQRALIVPVLYSGEVIGLFAVADKATDYGQRDVETLERIARSIAATLNARLQRDRQEERRKAAEAALRRSEGELREAQRLGRIGNWSWDIAADAITWSREYYRIYGFDPSRSPPAYQEHLKAYTPESAARLDAAVKRNMEAGEPYEVDLELAGSGPTRWVTARSETVRDAAGKVVGLRGTAQDITARKLAEEALRRSEERYRRIVETAHEGIWVIDAESRATFVNRKMAHMLGYEVEEMQGRPLWAFMDEEARREAEALVGRRREGIAEQHEFRFRRKDGSDLWTLVDTTPFLDDQGRYAGALGMITDVTARRAMEEQLRQSQKLEAVGRLAGGVAHDFNNLLTAILGSAHLLVDGLAPSDPLRQEALEIQAAGDKAALLTRQLLAFGRKQAARPAVVDLGAVVSGMDRMLRRLIGEDVELVTASEEGLGRVRADPGQIEQVILNLAVNARDAMPSGGRLTIETANVELGEETARRHPEAKPGPHVKLTVSDTGTGMTPEVRAHLFEPFFTTKRQGEGTGLGLSTVYGIVKQCGGEIQVQSEPGRGTTFTIHLPRVPAAAEAAAPAASPRQAAGGTETVLVVEDEGMVRNLAVRVLREAGYEVLAAADGEEALRLAAGDPARRIEAVVSDVVMPRMGGLEVARRLRAERPELRVLFTSGYTGRAADVEAQLGPGTAFLSKPFSPDELARKIRELLDGSPDPAGAGRT